MIVTRKFSAVAIDDAPANWNPKLRRICITGRRSKRRVARPAGVEGTAGARKER